MASKKGWRKRKKGRHTHTPIETGPDRAREVVVKHSSSRLKDGCQIQCNPHIDTQGEVSNKNKAQSCEVNRKSSKRPLVTQSKRAKY